MTEKRPGASKHSPYLTVPEVAKRLRVSAMTVYRLINESYELRADRIGRTIRVYEDSVAEFQAAARIGPES